MSESLWMYFFMVLGIFGIVLINIFGNVVVSNEQNYYLLKEVTEAAMYDAVDQDAYKDGLTIEKIEAVREASYPNTDAMHCEVGIPGTVRIITDKFLEVFIRRFAEAADLNRQYRVVIHDIDECPPKVSISLIATEQFSFVNFFNSDAIRSGEIVNSLTAILENYTPNEVKKK